MRASRSLGRGRMRLILLTVYVPNGSYIWLQRTNRLNRDPQLVGMTIKKFNASIFVTLYSLKKDGH